MHISSCTSHLHKLSSCRVSVGLTHKLKQNLIWFVDLKWQYVKKDKLYEHFCKALHEPRGSKSLVWEDLIFHTNILCWVTFTEQPSVLLHCPIKHHPFSPTAGLLWARCYCFLSLRTIKYDCWIRRETKQQHLDILPTQNTQNTQITRTEHLLYIWCACFDPANNHQLRSSYCLNVEYFQLLPCKYSGTNYVHRVYATEEVKRGKNDRALKCVAVFWSA